MPIEDDYYYDDDWDTLDEMDGDWDSEELFYTEEEEGGDS